MYAIRSYYAAGLRFAEGYRWPAGIADILMDNRKVTHKPATVDKENYP